MKKSLSPSQRELLRDVVVAAVGAAILTAWLLASSGCGAAPSASAYQKAELAVRLAGCVERVLGDHAADVLDRPAQPEPLQANPYIAKAATP